jgi:hypothetical protein
MNTLLESWKAWAVGDAARRGLHELKPILEGLAAATSRLRATAWHPAPDRADAPDSLGPRPSDLPREGGPRGR